METRGRTSRAEWQKRIERWNDSGLSAEQFAAERGINAGTLRHWKYFLTKPALSAATAKPVSRAVAADLVEVRPVAFAATATAFELELGADRELRIPPQFDSLLAIASK